MIPARYFFYMDSIVVHLCLAHIWCFFFVYVCFKCLNHLYKAKLLKEQCSSSSFLLTWYTGPKWPWSLNRLVPCQKWMELGCKVLLGHFGPVYLLQVSKNDDEEHCFLSNLALAYINYIVYQQFKMFLNSWLESLSALILVKVLTHSHILFS